VKHIKNTNKILQKSKDNRDDEFYTLLSDIEVELNEVNSEFKEKFIYCNCDNPKHSNFWKYFYDRFDKLKLKKLVATYYSNDEKVYKTEFDGTRIVKTPLKGNGDFRSPECIEILKASDIVVTNPPFSCAREFIAKLISHNKKFYIVGDLNWITYRDVFPYIKSGGVKVGTNNIKSFERPDGTMQKFGNKLWFTNLDISPKRKELVLTKHFSLEDYPIYDNYPAFECSRLADIPVEKDFIVTIVFYKGACVKSRNTK